MKPSSINPHPPTLLSGRIKWFDAKKGYGFILRDDSEPDLFVHVSSIRYGKENIQPGDAVEFEVETSQRGLRAANVRLKPIAAGNLERS